jgi:hypothetical protein
MRYSVKFGVDGKIDEEIGVTATSHLNAFAQGQAAMIAMREKGESKWNPDQPGATISVKLLQP